MSLYDCKLAEFKMKAQMEKGSQPETEKLFSVIRANDVQMKQTEQFSNSKCTVHMKCSEFAGLKRKPAHPLRQIYIRELFRSEETAD